MKSISKIAEYIQLFLNRVHSFWFIKKIMCNFNLYSAYLWFLILKRDK